MTRGSTIQKWVTKSYLVRIPGLNCNINNDVLNMKINFHELKVSVNTIVYVNTNEVNITNQFQHFHIFPSLFCLLLIARFQYF